MQNFSRMETIEHQEVKFSGRPVDEIFALPSPEPGVFFPSDSFLARALAAIPRTGSMVFEDEGPCTQACVTSKAGFEPLHVTRIMVDGQKKYVWCLGESPIFPRSSYTVSVTRSESDRPLMSIGKQVAVLINALNYHLVNFYLRERSSVPGFDPATFRLPVWAQWCAICKASPVAGPLLPRNPAPNQGSADRVIDVEDLRDIAIHSELYDIRKIVNAHKRTYLMTGRWRRSDIREIHEASCPSPVDYRNASGHVIQISQPLHSRSPAQADPFDVDGLGLSSFKERQRRAIGRAIRRVRDVRMVTGRLNSALVTLTFEESKFYLQLHKSDGRAVVSYPAVDAVAQPMTFVKLILLIHRRADFDSPVTDPEPTFRRKPEMESVRKVRELANEMKQDMKQLWINNDRQERGADPFGGASPSTSGTSTSTSGDEDSLATDDGVPASLDAEGIFHMEMDDEVKGP